MTMYPFTAVVAPPDGKKIEPKEDGLPVDIKLPVKHVLSRELQVSYNLQILLYFEFTVLHHINNFYPLACTSYILTRSLS